MNSSHGSCRVERSKSFIITGLEDSLNDFCLTSQTYQGVDLSPVISSKKLESTLSSNTFDEDTKSCDDVTFKDLPSFLFKSDISDNDDFLNSSFKSQSKFFSEKKILEDSKISQESNIILESKIRPDKSKTNLDYQTPMKSSPLIQKLPTRVSKKQHSKIENKTPKFYKQWKNLSALNLLNDQASPSTETPPALKFPLSMDVDPIEYYSPKRSRSEFEIGENVHPRQKMQKPIIANSPSKVSKLIKLDVKVQGNLGISLERKEAVRPFYLISKIDPNGDAAKSKQFWIGDEIVKICGRRIRGTPEIEARNALRNCFGDVEIVITRNPKFAFCGDLGDTWPEYAITRTKSDSEIWCLQSPRNESTEDDVTTTIESSRMFQNRSSEDDSGLLESEENQSDSLKKFSCQIVGAIRKDGKILPEESEEDSNLKLTGMKKFYKIRKRNSNLTSNIKKTISLPSDLLTIQFEEVFSKKLGFSIAGGSDCSRGNMGIFVKNIESGGQAAEEGKLQNGDEIWAVNGIYMEGFTREKAKETIKAAKARKMILHIRRRGVSH